MERSLDVASLKAARSVNVASTQCRKVPHSGRHPVALGVDERKCCKPVTP